MKKMKKFLSIVLVLLMAVSVFVGCDEGTNDAGGSGGSGGGTSSTGSLDIDVSALPAGEVAHAVVKLLDDVDSVHIEESIVMDVNMMGMNQVISGESRVDVNTSEKAFHGFATINMSNMNQEINAEVYMENNGDVADIYIGTDMSSEWSWYHVSANKVDTAEYTKDFISVEEVKLFLNMLKDVERTESNIDGKSAILIEGAVDFDKIGDMVKALGFGDFMEQNSGGAVSSEQIESIYSGLASPKLSVYLDSATGLPLQINIDLTEFFNSFYENAAQSFGENVNMSVNKAVANVTFSDYNNVSITIPEDVKNSADMSDSTPQVNATPNVNNTPSGVSENYSVEIPQGSSGGMTFQETGKTPKEFKYGEDLSLKER